MEKTDKKGFKKWLEYLQQESWQLELIISSILLVVLSSAGDEIGSWMLNIRANGGQTASSFIIIIPFLLFLASTIAKTNLVIHIFLRGFWIGCIGLRYVSGEIDIDSLKYAPKFSNYLKRRGMNFDRYLETLEKICSIIFSFTFLLVFSVFSIFLFFITVFLVVKFFNYVKSPVTDFIEKVVLIVLMTSAILSLIDYTLLGFFKRKKILATIFYPFYRLFNFLSFSFIYRPLYYNFIDNRFGRKYLILVIPYIIILIIFGDGLQLGEYKFLPGKEATQWINANYYQDKWRGDYEKSNVKIAIPSMEIEKDFFPVYLKYADTDMVKNALEASCPDFDGYKRWSFQTEFIRGVNVSIDKDEKNTKTKADSALYCLSQIFDLKIDTVELTDLTYHFYQHPELKSKGLLTYIDISSFERGDHVLHVKQRVNYRDSVFSHEYHEIPFVKFR